MSGFDRIAVLGLGLLGGSLALAARRCGAARTVVGGARRPEVRREALARGAVDAAVGIEEAVRDAELVVLATPVLVMADVARRIGPGLRPGALVTDVGSVKGCLHETLPGVLPRGVHYVGSHPMAGGHESGLRHAREDLFEGATCVVTGGDDPKAVERVAGFWGALGARVVRRDPEVHDAEVAWASHAPHAIAFAFGGSLRGAPEGARDLVGPGFRDFTRIAQSDPEMWAEILTANRKALAAPLHAFSSALAELERAIESNDTDAVERWLAAAREALCGASRAVGSDAEWEHRSAREGTQGRRRDSL